MKIYLVGGIIRDKLMGLESDDFDYTVVLDDTNMSVEEGFKVMKEHMLKEGFRLFLVTPEMFTIRGLFPKNHKNKGLVADFVLARKEVGYVEGTRRPILELGTLEDDLRRRDFTVNAMAEDENGIIIDLFGGMDDLSEGVLNTPVDPSITMLDDPLRLLRALRFSITKSLSISPKILEAVKNNPAIIHKLVRVVSNERIREELNKMFRFDSIASLRILNDWDDDLDGQLLPSLFKDGYRLEMTNRIKQKNGSSKKNTRK